MLKSSYVILSMLCAASAIAKSDYYAGLQLGGAFSKFDAKIDGTVTGDLASSSHNLKESGFSSRLVFGAVNNLRNGSLLGWDVFFGLKDNEAKKNNIHTTAAGGDVMITPNSHLKIARDYTIGTSARWGCYMTDSWATTVNLGLLYSQFKTTFVDAGSTATGTDKRRAFGIAPGVGLLMNHQKFLCRLDYAYEMYRSFKTKDLSPDDDVVVPVKAAPRYHSVLVTVGYKF